MGRLLPAGSLPPSPAVLALARCRAAAAGSAAPGSGRVLATRCRNCAARGIGAARLFVSPLFAKEDHLAHKSLADLFMDTPLFNAHTTVHSLACAADRLDCRSSACAAPQQTRVYGMRKSIGRKCAQSLAV